MAIEKEEKVVSVADEIDEMMGIKGEGEEGEEEFIDPTVDDTSTTPIVPDNKDDKGEDDTAVVAEDKKVDSAPVIDDIEALRQRIADMSITPAPKEEEKEFDPASVFADKIDYITPEMLEQIAENPILLNDALNTVRQNTAETMLQIVPVLIQKAIAANTAKMELHNTFYGANPELTPYKKYVSVVAKEVTEKNPDKSQDEILAIVANSVKASLKLDAKKDLAPSKKEGAKPALRQSGGGGGRKAKVDDDPNSMKNQIAELLNI